MRGGATDRAGLAQGGLAGHAIGAASPPRRRACFESAVCAAPLAFAGSPQSARRLPAAKAAGGLSIGELAHRPALDRRAARADHTLRAPPTGKSPDKLCLPTPARGARLRPLLWGRRMAGSERLGPKRFKRPRARCIAQSGWPRRPPASAGRFFFLLSSHLAFFLAIALFVFSAFLVAPRAQAAKQNRVGRSQRPFSSLGFSLSDAPSPRNKKSGEIRRERSAFGKFDWIRAPGPFGARPWSHSKSSLSMRDCLFSEFWPSSHS